jgi:hypothetical protein
VGVRAGRGVFERKRKRFLAERIEISCSRRFHERAVGRGRGTDVDGVDVRIHHRLRVDERCSVEVVVLDERVGTVGRRDRCYACGFHLPVSVQMCLCHESAPNETNLKHTLDYDAWVLALSNVGASRLGPTSYM